MLKCEVCGTEYLRTGGVEPLGLAFYKDGGVFLSKTGHQVDKYVNGEGVPFYYGRVALQVGGNPQHAGALMLTGDTYNIGHTGDPVLDAAVHVDAFANPEVYGLGTAGSPPVAAGPGGGGTGGPIVTVGGPPIYVGTIPTGGVNSDWKASNPEQVQYADISADGTYSVVCDGVVPVHVGVGFAPGIATYFDLLGAVSGTQTAEVYVKAGQYLCFAHDGAPGNRMRACQR